MTQSKGGDEMDKYAIFAMFVLSLLVPSAMPVFVGGAEWVLMDSEHRIIDETSVINPGYTVWKSISIVMREPLTVGDQFVVWYKHPHALAEVVRFVWAGNAVEYYNTPAMRLGDANNDNRIGWDDLSALIGSWGSVGIPGGTDVDYDGRVGFSDLLLMLQHYGQSGAQRPHGG
jgi:hypothetical protein